MFSKFGFFNSLPRFYLKTTSVIIFLALYFGTVMNYPVLTKIFELSENAAHPWFPYTAPFLLFFSFLIIFSCLAVPYLFKPLMAIIMLTSAAALYAAVNFQTMFDTTMMENVFETNYAEASFYINTSSLLYILVFGVVPTIFLFMVDIVPERRWFKAILSRISVVIVGIVGIVIIATISYKDYASVGRNNKYLSKMIIPAHVFNSVKYLDRTYLTTELAYKKQGLDAHVSSTENGKPTLVVVVLGETARAMNFKYNGYQKNTNPYTEHLGFISFSNVSSCGTYTSLSVPCMFSNLNRSNYDKREAKARDNVLNIFDHAGVDVMWIDNDGGDKGVAQQHGLPYMEIDASLKNEDCNGKTCFDAVMLEHANEFITHNQNSKLLVLHTIGSHGPTYWQRYPKHLGQFTPSCDRSDIEKCSDEEIVNVYDNTLVYTDYVLSEVVKQLKNYADHYNVAMMYISDHGESLGEKGLYLHGTPYAIAPIEQTQVPWLIWMPEQYAYQKGISTSCIRSEAETNHFSHDNFFHSLLSFYGVQTELKQAELDFVSSCQENQHG
ncbi:phosphoethanolamine transferase [Vibrio olivae]|uniref:Phosphoethanolamine transferase n=1 Tax=Vibrio olivae TaxID=1243002 RepID=A0ABV5HN61_9VIBR